MAAFTSVETFTSIKYSHQPFMPNWAAPGQAQGEEAKKLLELFAHIVSNWQDQPPRGLLSPSPLPVDRHAAIELLRSWREDDDDEEQRETWEYLKQTLEEDRLSNRKLFK